MKFQKFLFAFLLFSTPLLSQKIQSPKEFLGYQIGDRFTRHHKVIEYFRHISQNSENVILEKYGETNENRPLYIQTIHQMC